MLRGALQHPLALHMATQGETAVFIAAARIRILHRGNRSRKMLIAGKLREPLGDPTVNLGWRKLGLAIEVGIVGDGDEGRRAIAPQ